MSLKLPTFNRSLIILLATQIITGSTIPILFLVSGLLGPQIAPTLNLSTLPMSLLVVGVALLSPVSSWVMSKIGRKHGHLWGLFLTFCGVAISFLSIGTTSFGWFCLGSFLAGGGMAFNNQIRFTAAECAGDEKALVHSWILMVSLFAAFLGPWITQTGRTLLPLGEYTGSLVLLLVCLVGAMCMIFALPYVPVARVQETARVIKTKMLKSVLSRQEFWLSVLCGMSAFATMTLLMSATPLQMHTIAHFSNAETTMTIQSHIMAMYFPSLFSGLLLARVGLRKLILGGTSLFFVSIWVAFNSLSCHDYWWALVVLGIAWNFLFLAGSTGISLAFTGPERFMAQGLNDALVYGTQSIASLSAGWLLFTVGWSRLVWFPVPLLGALLVYALVYKLAPVRS